MNVCQYDVIVVGGGAAGFFGAIQCAQRNPLLKIAILEKNTIPLQKVKISGGGRCNLTHACFNTRDLIQYYPRGGKAMRDAFNRFGCQDTIDWFAQHGVKTKVEADGRVFPESNNSMTIVICLLDTAKSLNIELITSCSVQDIIPINKSRFELIDGQERKYSCKQVLIAPGGSPKIWSLLEKLGHTIVTPLPSLFTFNIHDSLLEGLPGISVQNAEILLQGSKLKTEGPLLITHWGLSGPSILKLSSFGARELHARNYVFGIFVNWVGISRGKVLETISILRSTEAKKKNRVVMFDGIATRLWQRLLEKAGVDGERNYGDLSNRQVEDLGEVLTKTPLKVEGKSTFKDEFVTAGGVDLTEIDLTNFQSKIISGIFLAGEIINVDALTGGFNFQAAWTGGYLAAGGMGLFDC